VRTAAHDPRIRSAVCLPHPQTLRAMCRALRLLHLLAISKS
jgi:hypothetical protein